ncbi:MAG: pyridoxamine 5'-phosphate oxidase family protein [Muribaculaceae bacterium]|nr:pyridoxamine 5'-phosphate oxidase family protein [Muribaculaceae bacterium]
MERKMRRFKQQLPEEEIKGILYSGKYAVLAVEGDDSYPYAVPVNYVFDGKAIYIHSAKEGHKVDSIRRNPKCSLCVVSKDKIVPEEFTSYFESVIVFGKAFIAEDTDEVVYALRLLSEKYSPGINPENEITKFLNTVCIIRIDIEAFSGKEAIELTRQRKQ